LHFDTAKLLACRGEIAPELRLLPNRDCLSAPQLLFLSLDC
jgi:hypothetical protein